MIKQRDMRSQGSAIPIDSLFLLCMSRFYVPCRQNATPNAYAKTKTNKRGNIIMTNKREQETLFVNDLIEILQISRNSAYELVKNNPPFRVLSIGRTLRIPSRSFFAWLDGLSENSLDVSSLPKAS